MVAIDLVLGPPLTPSQAARTLRQEMGEAIGIQIAQLVERGDTRALAQTLTEVGARSPSIDSMGVRRTDGYLLAQTSEHARRWLPDVGPRSPLTHTRIPLLLDGSRRGEVEIVFAHDTGFDWREHPTLVTAGLVGAVGLPLFYLFLRRSTQHLQPKHSAPDRVRQAFDTLPDGAVVLDHRGRVVLANRAFRRLHPQAARDLTAQLLSDQAWLAPALAGDPASHPWSRCLAEGAAEAEQLMQIPQPAGPAVQVVVNCGPIHDGAGELRGCLVTFDDVSDLQQANARLRAALSQLEASRQQVEEQNRRLQHLATRDALTECLNRRAFFLEAEPLFALAAEQRQPLSCIMCDVDHFKSLNDRFGHPLGDEAIRTIAALLATGLRHGDLLCRYGGEEFCILLPDTERDEAGRVAERLRKLIDRNAAARLRMADAPSISCSFGVATLETGVADLATLIARADEALYAAKNTGRNRVISAQPEVKLARVSGAR
jgi:diguanylate cyclase (GGDEF)-like protein/PAS domain S-box-containing protein